jgi:hypothetical protein
VSQAVAENPYAGVHGLLDHRVGGLSHGRHEGGLLGRIAVKTAVLLDSPPAFVVR